MSPATVDTSTNNNAVQYNFQRKSFYAEGLFWAFYSDGTDAGWEFTNDPTNWAGAFTSIGACALGHNFSIWFDGTYIHYARADSFDLFYRRGTPENDGTITWSAEQTVKDGLFNDRYMTPCITVDTNGYAWIGVYNDQIDGDDLPVVVKNNNNDGTWALDFAYELSAVNYAWYRVCPIPLIGGKMYVVYCRDAQTPRGKLYDAGWGVEEADLADHSIEESYQFSVVAIGDNVHFVYNRDGTNQIRHNERVWGVGWDAADVLVQDAVGSYCGPALSVDPSKSTLYCFWTRSDHVNYKKYDAGWGGLVDWIDETTDDIQFNGLISSFYMDYGDYIGLLYVTKTGSPYNVRFAFLQMGWTGKISGVVDPAKIAGVAVGNIASVKGVA